MCQSIGPGSRTGWSARGKGPGQTRDSFTHETVYGDRFVRGKPYVVGAPTVGSLVAAGAAPTESELSGQVSICDTVLRGIYLFQ